MSRVSGRRSSSLGAVRKAAEYAWGGVEKATTHAKDGFEELLGYHLASRHEGVDSLLFGAQQRHEAINDGRAPKAPACCEKPLASSICKEQPAAFGLVATAGNAATRLRRFSLSVTRATTRDGFEEFYDYEGRPEPRTECDLEGSMPAAGETQLLKHPVACENSLASAKSRVRRGRSPAALVRRQSTASNTKTRNGFEEFFGYEDTKMSQAESSSANGIRQRTCKRPLAVDPPSQLRDRFGRSLAAKREETDHGANEEPKQLADQQALFPQVMDATEASLSMIRTAIEEKKELLKAEAAPEQFEQLCEEIRLLKAQQARLAGALWETQLQNDGEDVGTEMQLKAWLGNV